MQYTLSSVTKLSTHWICGPMDCRTPQDFCEMACRSCGESLPAPGMSRSMTNLGMVVFSFWR